METVKHETRVRGYKEPWSWTLRHPGMSKLGNIRFADWDDEGHLLVATTRGLFYWNRDEWCGVNAKLDPLALRFVRSAGSDRWVLGAKDLWRYANGEVSLFWEPRTLKVDCFNGSLDDVALVGGRDDEGIASVQACVRGRWLRPMPLEGVESLTALARIDVDRWLVTGQTAHEPFAAIVAPLLSRMRRLRSDAIRFVASAGRPEIGVGCAVGSGGVLLCDRVASAIETVSANLSAVAVDPVGRIAVAKGGKIWLRRGAPEPGWIVIRDDRDARRPIVSLHADGSTVLALTNDAAILEGRTGAATRYDAPPLRDIGEGDDDPTKPNVSPMRHLDS
jgi:hypothetical protein